MAKTKEEKTSSFLTPAEFERFFDISWLLSEGTSASTNRPFPLSIFYTWWFDLQLKRINSCLERLSAAEWNLQLYEKILPNTSSLRFVLHIMLICWPDFKYYQRGDMETVYFNLFNFFTRYLNEVQLKDPYVASQNVIHNHKEIEKLLQGQGFLTDLDERKARSISHLILSAGSLVHGLYNDLVTDVGWDTYGPYAINQAGYEGNLLLRNFPNLSPTELGWGSKYLASIRKLSINTIYEKSVKWRMVVSGCHTMIDEGDPIKGLRMVSVKSDEENLGWPEIEMLTEELLEKSQTLYQGIHNTSFEEQKQKALQQECYRFKDFFDYFEQDWRPTEEMAERVKDKTINEEEYPYLNEPSNDKDYFRKVLLVDEIKEIVAKK